MKHISRFTFGFLIAFIVSGSVYVVNRGFGNKFLICFQISALIFINIFLGFLIYYAVRDVYATRWTSITLDETKSVTIKQFLFPLSDCLESNSQNIDFHIKNTKKTQRTIQGTSKGLYCELITPIKPKIELKQLIIFIHGFNSSTNDIRHLGIALALKGFTSLLYDARGSGNTKFGNKSQISLRSIDLLKIIRSIQDSTQFHDYNINFVAESIGGINLSFILWKHQTTINFNKMILISVPPVYNSIFPKHIIPLTRKWFIRLNYILKRLRPYLKHDENELNSPQFLIKKMLIQSSDSPLMKENSDKNNQIMNRILFIYSKTDMLISSKQIAALRQELDIPETNIIFFNKGGHNQLKNEMGILSAIVNFIEN
jgi:pimeloyl-ACP methyl ester carboxylesterase